MANETIVHYHELGKDRLDNILNAVSLIFGVPGNLLIFLAFRSFPTSACKFLYRLLAIFDLVSLVLLFTRRPLMWFDILQFEHKRTTAFLTIYLNIIYYISIFANQILLLLTVERLLHAKYPSSYNQYFGNLDRVKLTLIIEGLLIMAFCLIITIKMSYFGLAWTVIFLTFYTVAPALCLLACVLLIAVHYYTKYKDRKFMEKNRPLTASHSSLGERSPSHHSALSASGPFKGSTSSVSYKGGRKKDPYSLYLVEKSASESHLAVSSADSPKKQQQENDQNKNNSSGNGNSSTTTTMTKSKSGNCVNTVVVSLNVPPSKSKSYLSIQNGGNGSHGNGSICSNNKNTGTATVVVVDNNVSKGDYLLSQEQEEQLRLKKTRSKQMTLMSVAASMVVIGCCVPLTISAARLMKEDMKDFDLSDNYTYSMIMAVNISMYLTHSSKFLFFFLVSSVFRRHVMAVITCRQQALKEAEAVPPPTAH